MTDTDEATARHSTAEAGEAYWFFDSLMVIRAAQPGQPVIIEATVAPGGGAPLHVHAELDDSSTWYRGGWPCAAASRPSRSSAGRLRRPAARRPAHLPRRWATSLPSCSRSTPTTRSCVSSGPSGQPAPSRTLPPGLVLADGHGRRARGRGPHRPAGYRAADDRGGSRRGDGLKPLRRIVPGGQGPVEPAQEFGEVLVDDGLVVVTEPACCLAGREAEHGGGDQPFGARGFGVWAGRLRAVRPAPRPGPRGRPG